MTPGSSTQQHTSISPYAKLGLSRLREIARRSPTFEDFENAVKKEASANVPTPNQ